MRPDILASIQSTLARTEYFKELAFKHRMPDMFQESLPMVPNTAPGNVHSREIWLGTSMRKKTTDGKWYLIAIVEVTYLTDENSIIPILSAAFKRFFLKVSENVMFFKVDGMEKLQDVDGRPIIRLDPDQSEQIPFYQRLKQAKS